MKVVTKVDKRVTDYERETEVKGHLQIDLLLKTVKKRKYDLPIAILADTKNITSAT